MQSGEAGGGPRRIRTPDPLIRSQVLYPAELRARIKLRCYIMQLAEREGFEPSIGVKAYTPLAGERLQPLGHLSEEEILYGNYFK